MNDPHKQHKHNKRATAHAEEASDRCYQIPKVNPPIKKFSSKSVHKFKPESLHNPMTLIAVHHYAAFYKIVNL